MTLRPKIEVTLLAVFTAAASICSCASTARPAGKQTVKQIALAEHLPPMPPPSKEKPLLVVYPRGAEIAASSSFILGSTLPGYQVAVDGQDLNVNKQGFFAHVIQLKPGKNNFTVTATSPKGEVTTAPVEAVREKPPPIMSSETLAFDKDSLRPKEDQGRTAGDIIEFSCRATPGSKVSVTLAGHTIPLVCLANLGVPGQKKGAKAAAGRGVNPGLSAAFGQVYQRYPKRRPDFYLGLYKIQAEDNLADCPINFKLQKDGKETSFTAAAKITTIKQPLTARTASDDTIIRTAPDAGRLTPLPSGVRLNVDGYDGENVRCLYRAGKHVWIKKAELVMEENNSPAPAAVARTIIIKKDNYGESVVIPLSQRLPFTIEQTIKPNRLILKVYGVSSNTDWVYQAPVEDDNAALVDNVTWKQPDDGTYEVAIDLKNTRQWGFFADYGEGDDENSLVLHIKNAPHMVPIQASLREQRGSTEAPPGRLSGLTVCIDPGHGGAELGAIGLSAIREAQINLGIALKVKAQLLKEGATVYMTREDDRDVTLDERVAFAKSKGIDLLISIHNNALPDGRDPNKEHGTSTYFYHPQARELALALKSAMAQELQLKPLGTLYDNLALCRPSNMQAVLVEVAFIENPDEYAQLIDENFQQRAAVALKDGLVTYLGRD